MNWRRIGKLIGISLLTATPIGVVLPLVGFGLGDWQWWAVMAAASWWAFWNGVLS